MDRDNNLKPESIKKAYKRFQATDKDKSGLIDYTGDLSPGRKYCV